MPESKRIVLSGGPGTGKTSIISELERRGFTCYHEVSREIIQEELAKKTNILPWADLPTFSQKVIEGRFKQYLEAKPGLVFLDRSMIDSMAYIYKDNLEPEKNWLDKIALAQYYPKVFITPPWREIYTKDAERRESWEDLIEIHAQLENAYSAFGYQVILVPQGSIAQRADFVLENIYD